MVRDSFEPTAESSDTGWVTGAGMGALQLRVGQPPGAQRRHAGAPGHELAARSVRYMMGADTTASGAHSPAAANMTIA